jgi:acyl-coenzyme A thioesterase PaaI-like protein
MTNPDEPPPRLCYACGNANEHGLHMEFRAEGDRTICDFQPAPFTQGYPGRVHGGIVSSLLDETMAWAVYHAQVWAATARLNIRYRRPVPLEDPLRVEAWIVKNRGRLLELRAEVKGRDGALLAEADGTFMKLDTGLSDEMSDLARRTGRHDAPEVVA